MCTFHLDVYLKDCFTKLLSAVVLPLQGHEDTSDNLHLHTSRAIVGERKAGFRLDHCSKYYSCTQQPDIHKQWFVHTSLARSVNCRRTSAYDMF